MQLYGIDKEMQKNDGGCIATIGFFDGVHRGHRFLLDQVKAIALQEGKTTLVVTFPETPALVLRPDDCPKLLTTPEEKEERLQAYGIDTVAMLPFTQELAQLSMQEFMTDVLNHRLGVRTLVMGYDHRFGHDGNKPFDTYVECGKRAGLSVFQADSLSIDSQYVSSTTIRKALIEGCLQEANNSLGYAYTLSGEVVGGYHLGTQMGFPTANIAVNSRKLIPSNGVYAVSVRMEDGECAMGMLNIGHRPTMDNGDNVSVEVHIFDFNENIYQKHITVALKAFIRPECRFASVEELKRQLSADEQACRKLFWS